MVLAELTESLTRALHDMKDASIMDEQVLSHCLNEIAQALLEDDVQLELIQNMQNNIRKIFEGVEAEQHKRGIIQQAIFYELCRMLNPKKLVYPLSKERTNVVMFVGLQGSGKTTTCTKYASYQKNRAWKRALVCADTLRAGALDQLKQKAREVKIPTYGSYTESDPVRVAVEGIERFKKKNRNLIIVDTSGRHKQEATLFEEIRQVSEATKPDLVVFVMDGSIGQAAYDQAQSFKESVAFGAVIVTKMDESTKGGGTLTAVAATKSPILFLGTGEHMHEFEVFHVHPFVKRLLGISTYWNGYDDQVVEIPQWNLDKHFQMISEGKYTLRMVYEKYQDMLLDNGPSIHQILSGESTPTGVESDRLAKAKRCITIMDSMTNEELDSTDLKLMNESRIMQIAQGCDRPVSDVKTFLAKHKRVAKFWKKTARERDLHIKDIVTILSNKRKTPIELPVFILSPNKAKL